MHIKKLKHCCMVVTVGKAKIMTDPGFYSVEAHDKVEHVDIILITHEHADHYHAESVKAMARRMPDALVIANDAVGDLLATDGVEHRIMKHGDAIEHMGVKIEAFGREHAVIHSSLPVVSNVGYFIQGKLFFPGDAFTDPKKPVDVLAVPVTAPWMKISEGLDYALDLKPRLAFPVHDAVRSAFHHDLFKKILGQNGIEFIALGEGGELDVD